MGTAKQLQQDPFFNVDIFVDTWSYKIIISKLIKTYEDNDKGSRSYEKVIHGQRHWSCDNNNMNFSILFNAGTALQYLLCSSWAFTFFEAKPMPNSRIAMHYST